MKEKHQGELYICPTPIGNMDDITYRVVECLKDVDLIACEDTRNSRKLLNRLEIKKQLISYHKFNQEEKGKKLIQELKEGKKIAMISDAGTPAISDPGSYLVAGAVENGIKVVSLPGPSAVITAFAASGFTSDNFFFQGFLPKKGPKRREAIRKILTLECPVIFYESPERLFETLSEIVAKAGDIRVVIARELTKIHEEYIRGRGEEVLKNLKNREIKGEVTVIVEGEIFDGALRNDELAEEDFIDLLKGLLERGYTKKEAVKTMVEVTGASKREIYNIALKI